MTTMNSTNEPPMPVMDGDQSAMPLSRIAAAGATPAGFNVAGRDCDVCGRLLGHSVLSRHYEPDLDTRTSVT